MAAFNPLHEKPWYALDQPEQTDSPAMLVYPERIRHNIREMIRIAGDPHRLVPHIKTHKMSAVVKLQLEAGIDRFKCATIAEAEMLAATGAAQVLMAYQLNETKAKRMLELVLRYPGTDFASLVDNEASAQVLNDLFGARGLSAGVFIDVDNGMHRTGYPVQNDLSAFYQKITAFPQIHCRGFHVYDGHIRGENFEDRKAQCEAAFMPVAAAIREIKALGTEALEVIAGGSPTFPIHAMNPEVSCSPGTSLLWDKGYSDLLTEQPFLQAAVLVTRVISKPVEGQLTTDLGHKSVAAENPIDHRVFLLNLEDFEILSQSEEHLVVKIPDAAWAKHPVGEVLYGVPYHICPTVALYDEVQVVEDGRITGTWQVEARRKRINI